MRTSLHPNFRNKLLKVCARMNSDSDWERAAAALLATRMLVGAGLNWQAVIGTTAKAASAASKRPQLSAAVPTRRSYHHADDERRAGILRQRQLEASR